MNKEKFRLDMQGAIFDLDGTLFDSMWVCRILFYKSIL